MIFPSEENGKKWNNGGNKSTTTLSKLLSFHRLFVIAEDTDTERSEVEVDEAI